MSGRAQRDLLDALPVAIYETDSAGRITYYSAAAAELWGVKPELGKSEFCGSWKLYWPDGTPLPHDQCPMAMALRQKRPIRGVEAVAERPDGVRIPFMPYPTPLFDETGALTGAVNVLVDISERKQSEQEKQWLAAVVDSTDDAIVSQDFSGIITSWNPGAQRLFGYAAEEMIGKSVTLLIPPHLQHEETSILARVAGGQRVEHFETTRVRKDQTQVEVSITISPIRNEQGIVVGASKIARDITERKLAESLAERNTQLELASKTARKLAEQTLTERNEQLVLAGRAALVGSYAYDVQKGTMQVSEGYAAIHGLPEGTTETTISEWRARVHPEDLARAEGLRDRAFADRRTEDNAEYRIHSTGEVRWIERRGSILYDANGRPVRVVGVNIDVTERKKAETALRESEARFAGQREALELALNGAPLETSLGVFVRIAKDQLGEGVRAAFYLANPAHTGLHHVVGMPAAYAEAVDGFEIGPASLSCGLATHTGLPILTPDVVKEPRWMPWLWLAKKFDFRGCWSFPIQTVGGRFVGTLAIYWRRPHEATPRELELAAVLTATAAIIIARHTDAEQRDRAQDALRESEVRLNAVIEGAADGILTIDEAGIVRSLNTAAVKMFGYSAEEVIGRNVSMLAPEPYRSAHDGYLKRYRETREAQIIGTRREVEGRRKDGQTFSMDLAVAEVPSSGQRLFVGIVRDITERKRAEERQRTLVAELDHRVKNTLATVSAVVSQTRQGRRSVADFAAALEGRIRSMAATHELLSARRWSGVSLANLVLHELAPYANSDNTEINGPDVALRPEAGQAMAMVIHELATNAAKYGALSTRKGRVSIQWDRRLNGHPPCLVLEWREIGGPPVVAPGNSSYGTSTIRDLIPYEFGGTVDLVFAPEGVRCRLEVPIDWFNNDGQPISLLLARG